MDAILSGFFIQALEKSFCSVYNPIKKRCLSLEISLSSVLFYQTPRAAKIYLFKLAFVWTNGITCFNMFSKKKEEAESIGNPAGIGQGTGFGLRERDRDGIGLGHYRLRATEYPFREVFEEKVNGVKLS